MDTGSIVVCRRADGYMFTHGKEYTVLVYTPEFYDEDAGAGFTWPAYLAVIDDMGREVRCHANRFIPLEKNCMNMCPLQQLLIRINHVRQVIKNASTLAQIEQKHAVMLLETITITENYLKDALVLAVAVCDELFYNDRAHEKIRLRSALKAFNDNVPRTSTPDADTAGAQAANARLTAGIAKHLGSPGLLQGQPVTEEPPHAGVVCAIHGHVDLPQADYEKQITRLNKGWICPRCTTEKAKGAAVVLDWRRTDELLRYRLKAHS